jgi:hypothetical protein
MAPYSKPIVKPRRSARLRAKALKLGIPNNISRLVEEIYGETVVPEDRCFGEAYVAELFDKRIRLKINLKHNKIYIGTRRG